MQNITSSSTPNVDENNRSWEMMMSSFTDDLWTEILLRLPIKSLLQLKSVCKSWFSIISSHRFAKSHLNRSIPSGEEDDENLIVHLIVNDDGLVEEEDGSFSLLHLPSAHVSENLKFPYSQGVYPFVPPSRLFGFDCGIACVSVDVSNWPAAKNKNDIYLWNPTTKQSKRIPPLTILDDFNSTSVVLGFGFDHVDFDFKVVRVVSPNISAQLYSSNMNVWRKIEPNPIDAPYYGDFDLCLHGFLFAMGYNGMMSFDLNKEEFICDIKLPVSSFDARITHFNDSIAFLMYGGFDGKINLWTLDDEACLRGVGVKASWTLMLNIDVCEPLLYVNGLFNRVKILFMADDGERLLYDSKKKSYRIVPHVPFFGCREVFRFTKTLFSVAGFRRVEWSVSSSRLQDESHSDVEMDE